MQKTTKDTKILKIAAFVSLAFGAILTLTGSDDLAEFLYFLNSMDYGEPSGIGRFWFVLIASPFSVLLLVGLLRTSTSMLIRGGLILMSGYLLLNGEEFFGSQQIIPSGIAFLLIAWTGLTFTRTTQKGPALVALLGFGFVLMVGDFRTLDDVFDDLLGIDNMTRAYGMWSIIFGGSVLALSAAIVLFITLGIVLVLNSAKLLTTSFSSTSWVVTILTKPD